MSTGRSQACLSLLIGALVGTGAIKLWAAATEVTASIHVPPAEVYVLGDDIPLVWRFTNQSADPLAMLWEGCCRLNGKLAITANGQPVEVLPPGASSFHTYSKAETLPPGKPMEFSSRLADWVRLPAGGDLDIGGRYTGVLTNQNPQVPSGLALWTGTATAVPARLAVLGVDDYLAQRAARSQERGLALELSGPDRLPPLAPATFTVTMRNLTEAPKAVDWPGTFQLWLVNERGARLEKSVRHLSNPSEHLTIPPHGELKREFQFSSTDLNGEPFGILKAFLDLGGTASGEKRLPSSAVPVVWSLGPVDIAKLLNEAGSGPAAGLRNPALKLLRLHLVALQPNLAVIDASLLESERGRRLRDELRLAGCVQPLSPRAGPAFVPLLPSAGGGWSVELPAESCSALDALDGATQVARIAAVRRHLGWDVTPEIKPQAGTPVGDVTTLARSLAGHQSQLSGPVTWRRSQTDGSATNLVQFPLDFPPANVVLWLSRANGQPLLEVAQKPPAPGRPAWRNVLSAAEVRNLPRTRVQDTAALTEWLKGAPTALQPLVIADDSLTCGELMAWLQPVVNASLRMAVLSPGGLP